ncbi:Alanine--tRNA ligase [Dirofilaria immitis]
MFIGHIVGISENRAGAEDKETVSGNLRVGAKRSGVGEGCVVAYRLKFSDLTREKNKDDVHNLCGFLKRQL